MSLTTLALLAMHSTYIGYMGRSHRGGDNFSAEDAILRKLPFLLLNKIFLHQTFHNSYQYYLQ